MKQLLSIFLFFLLLASNLRSQDTVYARQVIKKLTSKEFYGRGYLHNGLDLAAKYIVEELKKSDVQQLFPTGYFQWFDQDVNTFPGNMSVKADGKTLKPGAEFIVSPESSGIKGKYRLVKKDSVTWLAENSPIPLAVTVQKKLTFSVAGKAENYCVIELLDEHSASRELKIIDVNIENKVLTKYISKNVCGFIPGNKNNDTVIVFTAHYDHLGGLGKQVFFPGANDNASGVSMLLNLVKYYSRHPPAYRIVFLFFAGEEAGLLGSKHFVEQSGFNLKQIRFLINLDLLGTGEDGIMVVNATEFKPQFAKLKAINDAQHLLKEVKQRGKAHNSDHYWFSENGVPCFFIYTLGGIKAYHDVFDVEKTLPLTAYSDVFRLLTSFAAQL
ncbi:MAG: M28 family metallopeptidase [Bacteroidia bacterium]